MISSFQKEIREALGITEEKNIHKRTKTKKFGGNPGGNPTPDQIEQWRINNDLHEIDLVSILMMEKVIVQTETKSTDPKTTEVTQKKRIRDAIDQVQFFREYLIRMHQTEVDNFTFIPTIAFPNLKELPSPKKKSQCYCKNTRLEDRQLQGDAEHVIKSQKDCNTVESFEALSIGTKRKREETENGDEVDRVKQVQKMQNPQQREMTQTGDEASSSEVMQSKDIPEEGCQDRPDKQSIKSSDEKAQSNGYSSRKDKDLENKNGCNRASPGNNGNAQSPVAASSSDNGTKTSFQKQKEATSFAVKEDNMNEDDRAGGGWYLGKRYETCASTVQGMGCLFFKWEFKDKPVLQKSTAAGASCLCGAEPLTISVPQRQNEKSAKRFQVCQAQGKRCEFFSWVDEPQRDDQRDSQEIKSQSDETFFKGTCKKHFLFKQHVENATELKDWWKQNCKPSTGCNVKDKKHILQGRLITTSSMVFTRLPRLLSKLTPDSQLILMRYRNQSLAVLYPF